MWNTVADIALKTATILLTEQLRDNSTRNQQASTGAQYCNKTHSVCNNCKAQSGRTNNAGSSTRKPKNPDTFVRIPHGTDFEITIKGNGSQQKIVQNPKSYKPKGNGTQQKTGGANWQNFNQKTYNKPKGNGGVPNLQNLNQKTYKPKGNGTQQKKVGFDSQNHKTYNKPQNYNKGPKIFRNNASATWMYLGRLKIGTTKDVLQHFLGECFPGYLFQIEPLPLYKDGRLPSFKVLVDNAILEGFQQPSRWPNGVKITKYIENFKN